MVRSPVLQQTPNSVYMKLSRGGGLPYKKGGDARRTF